MTENAINGGTVEYPSEMDTLLFCVSSKATPDSEAFDALAWSTHEAEPWKAGDSRSSERPDFGAGLDALLYEANVPAAECSNNMKQIGLAIINYDDL
ncbi:MAG: DUF1559 domain-containing protein [Pseudomonadota bacterium]